MISKAKIKLIHSLELKKKRTEERAFVAEGHKLVEDIWSKFECLYVAATQEWAERNQSLLAGIDHDVVSQKELTQASLLKTPQDVIAIMRMPSEVPVSLLHQAVRSSLCLALDSVQDPGNLGTIVRIADWFGIDHIICSNTTADVFAPKAIQATMGAIGRVNVHYTDLARFIADTEGEVPVYGTFLDGSNLYTQTFNNQSGIIVMGNEGRGISSEIEALTTHKLLIPNYPADRPTSESLNVAVATAIVCSEFRRRG